MRAALFLVVAGAALSACSHGLEKSGPPALATIEPIGNAQQYGDVINALDRGDSGTASKKLKAMLKHNPNDARAKLLLETIEADPVALLGAQSFAYTTRSNDSFRSLAEHYLGDGDKFYALARYNKITVPGTLMPGQTIRIPGTAPAAPPPPPPEAHVREPAHSAAPRAEAKPTPPPVAKPATPQADPARAAKYRAAGLAALSRGNVNLAVGLLGRAAMLDPGNPVIARDLDRARRIQRTVNARK
jgi:hypothetical protein